MTKEVDAFVERLPDFQLHKSRHRWLVSRFGFFLTEVLGESSIVPARIRDCYEAASMKAPSNISDVLIKSGAFVKTRSGLQLDRDIKGEIRASLRNGSVDAGPVLDQRSAGQAAKARNVVVIYGRDERLRKEFFNFLRALKLSPIEWEEAVKATGRGTPYVGEVLDHVFSLGQAVIALFTPDEKVELREDLRASHDDWEPQFNQPRPNVLLEAGMALAKDEARTIIVQVGSVRSISDLEGRHFLRLTNAAEKRHALASRLATAGCLVDTTGLDWLSVGDFEVKSRKAKAASKSTRKPK